VINKREQSEARFTGAMHRTTTQLEADRHAADLRRLIALDLQRMRRDAGLTQAAVAGVAGLAPSVVSKLEGGSTEPSLETYARVAAALGADLAARVYPNTGPAVHDRHQLALADLLLAQVQPRWQPFPEVAVRRPVRGWIDLVLRDTTHATLVATELESLLRRVEQLLRWSGEKAEALPSAARWSDWTRAGTPDVSQLLIVRWTRANREVARAARRTLKAAYPADPRDALDALTGTAPWPGAAMLWAQLEAGVPARLDPWVP